MDNMLLVVSVTAAAARSVIYLFAAHRRPKPAQFQEEY